MYALDEPRLVSTNDDNDDDSNDDPTDEEEVKLRAVTSTIRDSRLLSHLEMIPSSFSKTSLDCAS